MKLVILELCRGTYSELLKMFWFLFGTASEFAFVILKRMPIFKFLITVLTKFSFQLHAINKLWYHVI